MEEKRTLHLETIRERIDRSEYQVDAAKVAEAILGRTVARIWLVPAAPARHGSAPDASQGVLEAS